MRKSDTSDYYKVYVSEIQMEVDPTSFKGSFELLEVFAYLNDKRLCEMK